MSKDKRPLTLFFLRWAIKLVWAVLGLFLVALVHAMVAKWAESTHWDNLLVQISGPVGRALAFLTSQHWFWFISGLSVGIIVGIWAIKLVAKPTDKQQATDAPTGESILITTLRIDYEGIEGANKVEKETNVFIRARVRNVGSETAKNAYALLTSLEEVHPSGATTPTALCDATRLPWAGGKFTPKDLPPSPDARHFVDLMLVSKDDAGWIIRGEQVFADQDKLKRYRGTYRFHVTLCADNAKPATCVADKASRFRPEYPTWWQLGSAHENGKCSVANSLL